MKALFVNGSSEPQCGVNQFGKNLYAILKDSQNIEWHYHEASTHCELTCAVLDASDAIVYNWQSGQGGILSEAPFSNFNHPQYLIYHDNDINENAWDGIFFSDPTMTERGNWHVLGRPIPKIENLLCLPNLQTASHHWTRPVIGVHGFIGAWADQVVYRVMQEFEYATVAMSLPFARYGDADGSQARAMAERCRNMTVNNPGITLQIGHSFMEKDELIAWLARNDLNVYIRPPSMNWRGVSSAPDFAIAAKRPIAINKCSAFRHLHGLAPSICVEDNSLMEIIGNGLSPFVPFVAKWCDEDVIREQVERVLMSV